MEYTLEYLKHWKILINTVFRAEDAIKSKWLPILQATKDASQEEKEKIADNYVTAIATEILSHSQYDEKFEQ